jgi:hypothetical protein
MWIEWDGSPASSVTEKPRYAWGILDPTRTTSKWNSLRLSTLANLIPLQCRSPTDGKQQISGWIDDVYFFSRYFIYEKIKDWPKVEME